MRYNDSNPPLLTRNPLGDKSNGTAFCSTSKKNSLAHQQSRSSLRKSVISKKANKENQCSAYQHRASLNGKCKRIDDTFIKDQSLMISSKELKIQQLRLQINKCDDQFTGKTSMEAVCKQITPSQRSSFKNTQYLQKKSNRSVTSQEEMFSPKILSRSKSLVRKADVSSLLYDDARRRQQKQQFLIQSDRKQQGLLMSPKINANTNFLVLKKIANQFHQLVTDEEMNPLLALSVLEQIFNVDLNPNKNQANNLLVQSLVQILKDEDNQGLIIAQKLWHFIAIIVSGSSQNSMFTADQERYILENYLYFYKTRMTKDKKTISPQKPTFRPKTLSISSKLAQSYREKSCQQIENFIQNQKITISNKNGILTIEDLFHLEHLKRQADNQKKKIQKQNRLVQECTFKPDLSNSSSTLHYIKKKPKITIKPASKVTYMKTQYSQTHTEQKQNLNSNKITMLLSREEKERRRRQRENRIHNIAQNIKDVEKVMMRMSVGRQKRQFSNSVKERGYPQGQNWANYQRQMHRQSIQNSKRLKGLISQ